MGAQASLEEAIWRKLFKDNAIFFYEKDRQVVPSHHNKPLCVTANVYDIELRILSDGRSRILANLETKFVTECRGVRI